MKTKTLISTALSLLVITVPIAVAQPADAQVRSACFSAAAWQGGTASDADRPCTTVSAPDNDRVRVVQGSASQAESVCVINIANVSDARCHRVAPTPRRVSGPSYPQAVCSTSALCVGIGVPQEDGSGLIAIRVDGATVHCTLSNPTEETGRYRVPCSS